jgi:hypothetical protein
MDTHNMDTHNINQPRHALENMDGIGTIGRVGLFQKVVRLDFYSCTCTCTCMYMWEAYSLVYPLCLGQLDRDAYISYIHDIVEEYPQG